MRNNITVSEAFKRIMEFGDEFVIEASGPGKETRAWSRDKLKVSQFIANDLVTRHGYALAQVRNVFGGDISDVIYEATPASLGIPLPRFERQEVV